MYLFDSRFNQFNLIILFSEIMRQTVAQMTHNHPSFAYNNKERK